MAPKSSNALINGDVNYYNIDPFDNPFKVIRDDWWPFPDGDANYADTLYNGEFDNSGPDSSSRDDLIE